MAKKRIDSRSKVGRRPVSRVKKGSAATPRARAKDEDAGLRRRLEDLCEQIDIVLPEVTARVAALEHLLLEKQLCTRADLIEARAFVRLQEA